MREYECDLWDAALGQFLLGRRFTFRNDRGREFAPPPAVHKFDYATPKRKKPGAGGHKEGWPYNRKHRDGHL